MGSGESGDIGGPHALPPATWPGRPGIEAPGPGMESWLECSEAQSFRRHLITAASLSSRRKHSLMILRSMWISFPEALSYPRLPAGSVHRGFLLESLGDKVFCTATFEVLESLCRSPQNMLPKPFHLPLYFLTDPSSPGSFPEAGSSVPPAVSRRCSRSALAFPQQTAMASLVPTCWTTRMTVLGFQ